jgi:hypothetical protein
VANTNPTTTGPKGACCFRTAFVPEARNLAERLKEPLPIRLRLGHDEIQPANGLSNDLGQATAYLSAPLRGRLAKKGPWTRAALVARGANACEAADGLTPNHGRTLFNCPRTIPKRMSCGGAERRAPIYTQFPQAP